MFPCLPGGREVEIEVMEGSVSRQCPKQNMHTAGSKCVLQKDLWLVTREGSISDVESTLTLIKKNGVNINSRNVFGLTPLHIATWRNHIPIVRRLLAAGADPNAKDGESGWSSLHRAFHFGHLAVASILLQSGAYITLEDSKSRTPVDFLSGPVVQVVGNEFTTELFSWGSGVNYQLGTGNAHIQKLPCKVDSFHGFQIKLISAAKFHSAAVNSRGEVYTWGFGRGGRLGHSEFDIHSGQAAVISPRKVTSGLGSRLVKAIAAAKHHTVIATEGGEVFSWGSNREGQLGYTCVDTQPTPRRVSSLRSRIGAVAAANKHTVVVSDAGEVFTWGCNREGQLGYGTSNSASNYTPRVVEYLKGKTFKTVTAAKCHTIVLGADGEVFTWGHRLVTPRRVIIARNLKKYGSIPLKFHRKERLHVVAITAGMVHSMALTEDGALFFWVSSDPDVNCQQLYSMSGKHIVCIASGKYWTASVTDTGDVYIWDGKKGADTAPSATRLPGIKKATSVSVGETHLLIVASLYHPPYSPNNVIDSTETFKLEDDIELEELDGDFMFNGMKPNKLSPTLQKDHAINRSAPSLLCLCENAAAIFLLEPRNSMQLLEVVDSLEACNLKKHCEEIVIRNLDYIVTACGNAMTNVSLYILARLEKLLDLKSSDSWSSRRLPTPTATFPPLIYSEDDDSDNVTRGNHARRKANRENLQLIDCFVATDNISHVCKQVRALKKKLQQIETLESKQSNGQGLDEQQIAKLETKSVVQNFLVDLGDISTISSTKEVKSPRKSKRKQKKKVSHCDTASANNATNPVEFEKNSRVPSVEHSPLSKDKAENLDSEESAIDQHRAKGSLFRGPKNNSDSPKNRKTAGKKKKGGLRMFLSGGLDDNVPAKAPVVSSRPKNQEIPAWGGAKISKEMVSLRKILDEQGKTSPENRSEDKILGEPSKINKDEVESRSSGCSLSSYIPTNSIPVEATHTTPQVLVEDITLPSWGHSGTSPFHCRTSLRDIQMQQVKQHQRSSCHSPTTQTLGFSVSATGQGSPLDSEGLNRWFKPESEPPSSLRSIQIEEKAIKDFKRFYSTVKIVKKQF